MLNLPAKSSGETIREHTDNVLKACNDFIELYGAYFDPIILRTVKYACEYHDYGKISYVFQRAIRNFAYLDSLDNMNIVMVKKNYPHGYLSPAFFSYKAMKNELGEDYARILINAICYHHNRNIEVDASLIRTIISEDLKIRYPEYGFVSNYCQHLFDSSVNDEQWVKYAVVLGLLNKFDYYASCEDQGKLPVEIDPSHNGKYIVDFISQYFKENKWIFRDIQEYAIQNRNENLLIVASTGIGKTEAALLWCNNQKLFYTLPLKVSINAMYKRISGTYGYSSEKVALLHSDSQSCIIEENEGDEDIAYKKYEATRRLSYPITVCTVDQLFTFVYRYRGCELLAAHLKYTKLIIDEIQAYNPIIIAKLIYGLKMLTDIGGKFAIITATMPPVLIYFIDKYNIPHKQKEYFLIHDKLRHKINYIHADDFDYNKITCSAKSKKVLIICNTVKRAIEVYDRLKNEANFNYVKVLHSNFIKRHRKMLEEEIIRFADDKEANGIWISTQIVEASLDIDFDMLFTEMCPAENLLQRMGRCYRKRDYTGEQAPNVYIVDNKNGYGNVYKYKNIYDRSVEFINKYNDNYFSEQEKMEYVDEVYNTDVLKGTAYFEDIKKEISNRANNAPFIFRKSEAKEKFRDIEPSFSVIPQSVYDRQIDEFDKNCSVIRNKKSKYNERRKAQNFLRDNSISLSSYDKRTKKCFNSILSGFDYYTISYRYNFCEDFLEGNGLAYDEDLDELFL